MDAEKKFMPMQKGDVKRTFADVSNLEKAISYKPSTKMRDGVKLFVDWYVEYKSANKW